MPPVSGFSDNPFRTRSDLIRAAVSLLDPLEQYKSPQNARVKLATSTGAGFSETAAQLEGFARPLWIVADLLRLKTSNNPSNLQDLNLESWIRGLERGTDPTSPEYWGNLTGFDQRMVEMESIAYALLSHANAFNFPDDPVARKNLVTWLRQINDHKMPQSNWLWFRVLVNLALVKSLHVPLDEVKYHIDESLRILDTFYLGQGWSSDGLWCDERKQADYYSGSFAIQFAQLLFVRFAPEYDPERTQKYKEQAGEFAKEYWRYFAPDGAAIPFGRSLTYRFAFVAFWGVVALAGVELPVPVSDIGTVKGILLRHLRWWAGRPHIFNTDGTPNIGYAYPNMYMAEDYNSPQSVYWCLKSFLVLGLDEEHPFWQAEELPHPERKISSRPKLHNIKLIWPPRHIMCNTPEHTFLLSAGQSTSKRFKAREAKYGKFAYSAAFGLSVPCGPYLQQIAPDSTLAVSFDNGEDDWKVRWDPYDVQVGEVECGIETVPTLVSCWKPWKSGEVKVQTTLVPPMKRWPGWCLRLHHVKWKLSLHNSRVLQLVDGGFAASAQTSRDVSIFEKPVGTEYMTATGNEQAEDWWNDEKSALVVSESGMSGVVDLTTAFARDGNSAVGNRMQNKPTIIRADPNTNLVAQRSLIPAAQYSLDSSSTLDAQNMMSTFVTGIFAISASAEMSDVEKWKMWHDRPTGCIAAGDNRGRLMLSP